MWQGRAIVETKFRVRDEEALREAFLQAQSYALLLQARALAIASSEGVWWWRAKSGRFDPEDARHRTWDDLTGRALADLRNALGGS